MDLSAVRTLKEPGKGGISLCVHDEKSACSQSLFPSLRLNKLLTFFILNEILFYFTFTFIFNVREHKVHKA
jgi:hypothetical protein